MRFKSLFILAILTFLNPITSFAGQSIWSPSSGLTSLSTGSTQYWPVRSISAGTTTEVNVNSVVPYPMTVDSLYIVLFNSPNNGAGTQSYVFTLRKNGADTALTCTVSESNTSCTDTTNSVNLVRGDVVTISTAPSGTPTARTWNGLIRVKINDNDRADAWMRSGANSAVSTSATNYISLFHSVTSATETDAKFVVPQEGYITKLIAYTSATPGAGKSYAFTIRIDTNGTTAATALTCTISDSSQTCEDVLNRARILAGDMVSVSVVPSGTPTSAFASVAAVFENNIPGNFILSSNSGASTLSTSAANYIPINGNAAPNSGTTVNYQRMLGGAYIKAYAVNIFTDADNGASTQSYALDLYNRTTSTAKATCTLSETDNLCRLDDLTKLDVDDAHYEIRSTPSGTPTATALTVGTAWSYFTPTKTSLFGKSIDFNDKSTIITMGDSITVGTGSTDSFGYRRRLQYLFGVNSYDFVGSVLAPSSDSTYDVDTSGVGGQETATMLSRLPGELVRYMKKGHGKAVIIHGGTNDIQNNGSSTAISYITSNIPAMATAVYNYDPKIETYVMTTIPQQVAESADNTTTTSANTQLKTALQALQATNTNLHIVDMNAAFLDTSLCATNQDTCLNDALHPNDTGYQVMATVLYNCMMDHDSTYCDGN